MNLRILQPGLVVAIAISVLAVTGAFAQNQYAIVPISVRDAGTGSAVDTFGVHDSATYCFDGELQPGGIWEEGLPPIPPGGIFDSRFVDSRSSGCNLDQGQRVHMQEVAKLDTFQIKFQPGDGGYPITLSWGASAAWIATDWDSLKIQDLFGGFFVNVNMKVDTQAVVTNAAITSLVIIGRSRASGTLGVDRDGDRVPQSFALEQNYPNPFNPTTTIRFAVEKTAFTDVAVYNVIGQKVKTLAAEVLTPGFYTTTWNGTDDQGQSVTTGVYFVRMVAAGENASFSGLRKLLLLK